MNKNVRVSLVLVIVVVLVLGLSSAAYANSKPTFRLEFTFDELNIGTTYDGWGHFTSVGAISIGENPDGELGDAGTFLMHWRPGSSLGTWVFYDQNSDFVIKTQSVIRGPEGGNCHEGRFTFIWRNSSGDYFGMSGQGDFEMCATETGTYEGWMDGTVKTEWGQ